MAKASRRHWFKSALIWGVFGLAIWTADTFHDQLGISSIVLVMFAAVLLYVQHEIGKLSEKLGVANLTTFHRALERSTADPIDPQHELPEPLVEEGWAITSETIEFHREFAQFGSIFNKWLEPTSWRVQERADSEVGTLDDQGPRYGRRYELYLGQEVAGRLTISEGYKYSLATPEVFTRVEIWDARAYDASTLLELCDGVASHLAGGSADARSAARQTIRNAMLEAIWRVGPESIVRSDTLEFALTGSAEWYLQKAGFFPRPRDAMDDLLEGLEKSIAGAPGTKSP